MTLNSVYFWNIRVYETMEDTGHLHWDSQYGSVNNLLFSVGKGEAYMSGNFEYGHFTCMLTLPDHFHNVAVF